VSRTFVISDVHGHLDDLRHQLTAGGLLDGSDWAGGDADVWVLGDLVDRGPDGAGVVRLVRSLQEQAPEQVHVLLGNHEALMLGYHLFPHTRFSDLWRANGGRPRDQEALDDADVAWLRGLPPMALAGERLLVHSDTLGYLAWGTSIDEVNATVREVLAGDDPQAHFDVFARLTDRYDFLGAEGGDNVRRMLAAYGGSSVVHGHSIIGSLTGQASSAVTAPLEYADGLALAVDGGRYDGGPLLLVELD
jgi:hypothetical protein